MRLTKLQIKTVKEDFWNNFKKDIETFKNLDYLEYYTLGVLNGFEATKMISVKERYEMSKIVLGAIVLEKAKRIKDAD